MRTHQKQAISTVHNREEKPKYYNKFEKTQRSIKSNQIKSRAVINQERKDMNGDNTMSAGDDDVEVHDVVAEENHAADDNEAIEREEKGDEQEAAQAAENLKLHTNTVDLDDMKEKVFFLFPDRNRRLTRFWLLIILASVIATSGVAGDSGATVIGAMIVAPLMTPILGTMLGIVLGDGRNFFFSFIHVLGGGGIAILIGYLYGLGLEDSQILSENNTQIASRVEPKMTDLVAALATGAVGAISLVRKDIADTLPGVAIAISLVPPLCVVGLTLSTGNGDEAAGAMLLFATNVASILVLGVIIMYIHGVHKMVVDGFWNPWKKRTAICILFLFLLCVSIPLGFSSKRIRDISTMKECITDTLNEWASPYDWEVSWVITAGAKSKYQALVFVAGRPPFPDSDDILATELCGVDEVVIKFVPQTTIEL
jgi:uncharacterized hydrophobic protein (TIGR00271 family)